MFRVRAPNTSMLYMDQILILTLTHTLTQTTYTHTNNGPLFLQLPVDDNEPPLRLSGHDFDNGTDRPLAISQASWGIKGLRERALNKSLGFSKNGLRVCIPLYADTIDLPFCSSCLFNVPQWIARLSINQDLCKYIDVCLETLTQIRSYCTKNEL